MADTTRCDGRHDTLKFLWQPDAHLAGTAMAPSIVGDERQGLVLCCECRDGSSCYLCLTSLELRLGTDASFHDVVLVIRLLCTIDQRAALYTEHSPIGFYILVGTNDTRLHIKVNPYHIALLPLTTDGEISVRFYISVINRMLIVIYGNAW